MTFDEFIRRPQTIDNRIQHQLAEAERLRDLCDRVTAIYGGEKVQTTNENRREIWLTKYADSKHKVTELMEQYDDAVGDLKAWLYANMEFTAAATLEYRYCDNMTNKEIAEITGYAEQSVKNKVSKAIRKARELYERGQI